jgi:hypothetical protein
VTPSCLEVDLSKLERRNATTAYRSFVSSLPCVKSASAGAPLGQLTLAPMHQATEAVVACTAGSALLLDEQTVYQLVRRLFVGATAGSFQIVCDNEDTVDARTQIAREWAPDQGVQRSNSSLRLSRLITIKSAFGLSNTDLAKICRISRQQLYKWLSDDQFVELALMNWRRLTQLEQLAKDWNRISARPLRPFLNNKVAGSASLLDLLCAPDIDARSVREAFARFASEPVPLSREDKLRAAGIRPRRRPGALPWDD